MALPKIVNPTYRFANQFGLSARFEHCGHKIIITVDFASNKDAYDAMMEASAALRNDGAVALRFPRKYDG